MVYIRKLTTGHQADMKTPHYQAWRKSVLKRDHYRCQMPGCKATRALQAHHIHRWADAPLLRYMIDNGITLCKQHHQLVNKNEAIYMVLFTKIVQGKKK